MQKDVGQMVSAAVRSKQAVIEHVRKLREWEPVRVYCGGERRFHGLECRLVTQVIVVGHFHWVVVVDKFEMPRREVDDDCCDKQTQTDADIRERSLCSRRVGRSVRVWGFRTRGPVGIRVRHG